MRLATITSLERFSTAEGRPRNKKEAVWFMAYAANYFQMGDTPVESKSCLEGSFREPLSPLGLEATSACRVHLR